MVKIVIEKRGALTNIRIEVEEVTADKAIKEVEKILPKVLKSKAGERPVWS